MKRKDLLKIVDDLSKYKCKGFYYSLTLNYEKIVEEFKYKKYDIEAIKNDISLYDKKITSFNLTLTNVGKYNESKYSSYYHSVTIIFCDRMLFTFISPYLSNSYIEISDLDKLMRLYKEHKTTAKKLYNIIKK